MKSDRRVSLVLLAFGLTFLASCHEDPIPTGPGLLSVSVVDSSGPPVSDVEVRIAPLGLTARTDAQGVASFELAPGDYFVDANLCCLGPGFIDYHVPVTVIASQRASVQLQSCLTCL
jgi:hypothetical protein